VANALMGNEFMAVAGTIKALNVNPEYSRTGKLGPENATEAVLILQHAFSGTNLPSKLRLRLRIRSCHRSSVDFTDYFSTLASLVGQ